MRVAIAGAGKVGRSIAGELLGHEHDVLLIDQDPARLSRPTVPGPCGCKAMPARYRRWKRPGCPACQVVIAATGDDKVNLVISLLAKTEYRVPRVVARVNHPKNEWLFNEAWGVDVAVSTPRMLSALVEEAVSVGDLVRLLKFEQGPRTSSSSRSRRLTDRRPARRRRRLAAATRSLVAIIREGRVVVPPADDPLEAGDELLFVATAEVEGELDPLLRATRRDSGRPCVGARHHAARSARPAARARGTTASAAPRPRR